MGETMEEAEARGEKRVVREQSCARCGQHFVKHARLFEGDFVQMLEYVFAAPPGAVLVLLKCPTVPGRYLKHP